MLLCILRYHCQSSKHFNKPRCFPYKIQNSTSNSTPQGDWLAKGCTWQLSPYFKCIIYSRYLNVSSWTVQNNAISFCSFNPLQSAYRQYYSAETLFLLALNKIYHHRTRLLHPHIIRSQRCIRHHSHILHSPRDAPVEFRYRRYCFVLVSVTSCQSKPIC